MYFFDNSHKIQYKGEVKEGEPNGFGTTYYENGKIYYQGYYKEGQPHGYGIGYHEDGQLYYTGYFNKGLKDKEGILYCSCNGSKKYEGEFKEDKLPVEKLAELAPIAQKIIDRVGW